MTGRGSAKRSRQAGSSNTDDDTLKLSDLKNPFVSLESPLHKVDSSKALVKFGGYPIVMRDCPHVFALTVNCESFHPYFRTVYKSLRDRFFAASWQRVDWPISVDDFIKVMDYCVQIRLYLATADYATETRAGYAKYDKAIEVPKCINNVLTDLGRVDLEHGSLRFYPFPITEADKANSIASRADTALRQTYTAWARRLQNRKIGQWEPLSRSMEGNAFWLLSSVRVDSYTTPTAYNTHDHTRVRVPFYGPTPNDVYLAAYLRRGYFKDFWCPDEAQIEVFTTQLEPDPTDASKTVPIKVSAGLKHPIHYPNGFKVTRPFMDVDEDVLAYILSN